MAILDQLFGIQPQQQDAGGLVQSILSQRFQPTMQDVNQSAFETGVGRYSAPTQAMTARIAPGMDTATRLAQLEQQGAQTQQLNLQNQMTQFQMPFMQDIYRQLYGGQSPPSIDNNAPPVGFPTGQPDNTAPPQASGAPPIGFPPPANQSAPSVVDPRIKKAELAAAMGNKPLSEALMAEYNADPNVIQQKERATKRGAQDVEDTVQARGTQDVIGIYNKLKSEANDAPSGLGENIWADVTNAANNPSKGAVARGAYDADMNNLYLGMIRSLKGTGRVMQAELDEIKNAQPKATDSLAVKQSKIEAHMKYYTNRMTELGYDPATGNALGNNQLAPHNLSDVKTGSAPDLGHLSDDDLMKALK